MTQPPLVSIGFGQYGPADEAGFSLPAQTPEAGTAPHVSAGFGQYEPLAADAAPSGDDQPARKARAKKENK